ncbi:hypothetical protein [Notoacmeibacter ruber]|uniref:hypothetical protein n=1 Tax=Notoacmeibacter ruber TaxID=2670375 RepID=UPI0011C3C707|nr:hypothetical protein [Notoacmeibacter ruber]
MDMLRHGEDAAAALSVQGGSEKRKRLGFLIDAPELSTMVTEKQWIKGGQVGIMLCYINAAAHESPSDATVNFATRVAMKVSERCGWPASGSTVRNAWVALKDVAHLWAADAVFAMKGVDWLDSEESDFWGFLILAEGYRKFGVSQGVRGAISNETLLSDDMSWTVADNLEMPDFDPTGMTEISEELIQIARDKGIFVR